MKLIKKFKQLLERKRTEYYNELALSISAAKDSKSFWSTVRRVNGMSHIKSVKLDAKELAEHFGQLLNVNIDDHCFSYALPYLEVPDLDNEISAAEVKRILSKCKDSKAPGEDRVPVEFLKYASDEFIDSLTAAFNHIFNSSNAPDSFRKSIIFPLYKKGDPNSAENYRGISFCNACAKVFASILHERLCHWVDNQQLLSEFQSGFRKRYSTMDNIFLLNNIANLYISKNKKLYVFFVDFKAAFDSILRNALFYKLGNLGVSSKFMQIIQSLYLATRAAVWDGSGVSDWFFTNAGVKQGCVLSPLLFALFLDDLVSFLPGGITIDGVQIKVLMYADDIVLIAESPRMMQLMINKLSEYCKIWNLVINVAKSKIMIFKQHMRRLQNVEKWYLNDEQLEVVKEFKYLGVWLNYNATFNTHVQKKLKDAKTAMNSTWKMVLGNKRVALTPKYKVFQATVNTIMCYASQVWGISKYADVEKLLTHFIKRIFRLPCNTPNYAIYLETGLSTLFIGTLKTHFQYINKLMSLPDERLPKQILKHLLAHKSSFFVEWLKLADEHQECLNLEEVESWTGWQERVLIKQDQAERDTFVYKANTSYSRRTYRELCYNLKDRNYFNEKYTVEDIRIIFKTRTELLRLNYIPYESGACSRCSLCFDQPTEDVHHFVAICPILKEIRINNFNKAILNQTELLNVLNGENWPKLCTFVEQALRYRQKIINEDF